MRNETKCGLSGQWRRITPVLGTIMLLAVLTAGGEEPAEKPVFQNGNFNTLQKLNPVQVKLMQKKNNVMVNYISPAFWLFNRNDSKLEMCQHPDDPKNYYAKLTGGILYQIHYGDAKFYRVAFRAKGPGDMRLLFYRYHTDEKRKLRGYISTKIAAGRIKLGPEWKKYSYVFRKEFDDEVFALAFAHLSGDVCFDDVIITEETGSQK